MLAIVIILPFECDLILNHESMIMKDQSIERHKPKFHIGSKKKHNTTIYDIIVKIKALE